MILNYLPRIKEFDIDDRKWRIDWVGPVHKTEVKDSEPNIDVVLSPLSRDVTDPTNNGSIFRHHRRVVPVGVGYLPVLRICSTWKKGRTLLEEDKKIKEETLTDLEIHPRTYRIISAGDTENDELLINPRYYDFGGLRKDAKCLVVKSSREFHNVIIPMAELIRFYYASSSELAKRLFWGELVGPHNWVSKTKRDRAFVDGKNLNIKLERQVEYPSELRTIARIIGSPEAEKGARLIYDSIVRSKINTALSYPETILPFEGVTTIKCHGKRIAQDKEKRLWNLLVFWIDSCSGPFPYDNIILDDGEGVRYEEVSGQTALSGSGPGGQKNNIEIRRRTYKLGSLRSDVEPDVNSAKNIVLIADDRFPGLNNRKIFSNKKEYARDQQLIIQNIASPNGNDSIDFATGDGAAGSKGIRKLAIVAAGLQSSVERKRQLREPALPASFDEVVGSLNYVKIALKDIFDFQTVPATAIHDDCFSSVHGICNFFPERHDGKRLAWAFINTAARIRRQVLVVQITYKTFKYYLLEIEHRKKVGKSKDSFAMLLLNKRDLKIISTGEISDIIVRCAINKGVWFDTEASPFPALVGKKIKHTSKNIETMGNRVLAEIKISCGEIEDRRKRGDKHKTDR